MSVQSLSMQHLSLRSAADVYELLRRLGYPTYDFDPTLDDLDALDLDDADRAAVKRAYVIARLDGHSVYLYELNDSAKTSPLRNLAWHALQRGTALLIVTHDYTDVLFVDPRAAKPTKSSVRLNKLKVITADPTRHDADTLNAIHAHRRNGRQIYDAQGEAFNVTTVTKKFYDEYYDHYQRAVAAARQYNRGIREFQDEAETDKLHAFTQRLLGRLMFLYFLQRKGWLGKQQKFLTEKYHETMRRHADEPRGDEETFYYFREVLQPLFFETLNTKRPDNLTLWSGIRIPYLNGGLFDASRDPDGVIVLPDSLFDPYTNDGLLAFFNRYNFTITDDAPLEQDVAVDPEMLGKVFENLLEERERGQSGSFYTPRAIVNYMCQEALAGYLEESAAIPRETTRTLFDPDADARLCLDAAERMNAALDTLTVLDPAVGSGSFLIGMMTAILLVRRAGYAALHPGEDIPAALLVDWKESIIRDTLYGVDIKPEAIEIAQLRLWLALVVDQTLEQARPLPNLDYKLMAGNSLIETIDGEPVLGKFAETILHPGEDVKWDQVREQLEMFDANPTQARMLLFDEEKQVQHERIRLDTLRAEFFNSLGARRRELRDEITAQERRIVYASLSEKADAAQQTIDHYGKIAGQNNGTLKKADANKLNAAAQKLGRVVKLQQDMAKPNYVPPFFLYRLHFSEVFERKGGFDIVIANPPYVRGDVLGDQKIELQRAFPRVYSGRADLYVYFYARAIDLLKPVGVLAFITSNKWIRAKYGKMLRLWLPTVVDPQEIADFGELRIFREASTFPMVFTAYKNPYTRRIRFTQFHEWDENGTNVGEVINDLGQVLPEDAISEGEWRLVDRSTRQLLTKMRLSGSPLLRYVDGQIFRGIVTGLNTVFVVDAETRKSLIDQAPHNTEIIKRFIVGDDVRRWNVTEKETYIIFTYHGIDINRYPIILKHLEPYKEQLEQRATSDNHEWYELQQPQMGIYPFFEQPKIIYPEMAMEMRWAFDATGLYINNKAFTIPVEDYFLYGVLNSAAVWEFLKNTCTALGDPFHGGRLELRTTFISQIPIPDTTTDLRERIAAQSRRCLDAAASAPEKLPALEAELNALVYQAYVLDEDDIRVIEAHLAGHSTTTPDIETDTEAEE